MKPFSFLSAELNILHYKTFESFIDQLKNIMKAHLFVHENKNEIEELKLIMKNDKISMDIGLSFPPSIDLELHFEELYKYFVLQKSKELNTFYNECSILENKNLNLYITIFFKNS
jgi:hypothetical protein